MFCTTRRLLRAVLAEVRELRTEMRIIMSDQEQLDADENAVLGALGGVVDVLTQLVTAVDGIKNQPPEALDFTTVDAVTAAASNVLAQAQAALADATSTTTPPAPTGDGTTPTA